MRVPRGLLLRILSCLVVAWPLGPEAGAQDLGRLFSTPAERDRLDLVRASGEQAGRSDSDPGTQSTSRLSVNGLVMRERGPDSVWINGERVSRGERTREGIRGQGEAGARVRVILPRDAGILWLKAGQKIDFAPGAAHGADPAAAPATGEPPGARTGASEP